MTNAPTSSRATIVSAERLAVMFSSRPTPTTASPPAVAVAFAGSRDGVAGVGDRRLDPVDHDGALFEARRTELEQHLRGVAVVGDERPLQRRRGGLEGLQQIDAGRGDGRRAGHVGQPADGRRQARRPDDRRVVGLGPGDEVDDEGAHLVGEDAVATAGRLGLDEDPERGRQTRLVLEQPGVPDRRARLVGPVDRVALDPRVALHQQADHGEHERRRR